MSDPIQGSSQGPLYGTTISSNTRQELIDVCVKQNALLRELVDLVERFANFDCFKPWGVLCEHCTGGEQPCEACDAKDVLRRAQAAMKETK